MHLVAHDGKILCYAFQCLALPRNRSVKTVLVYEGELDPAVEEDGFFDAEVATIGRKFYYGLPWPSYVAEGAGSLSAWGKTIAHFPVNAIFWTVVVALLSCIPGRKVKWRRIIGVTIVEAVFFGAIAALVYFA